MMDRKKAILAVAAVNALLLLTLFITALTTTPRPVVEREIKSPAFVELVSPPSLEVALETPPALCEPEATPVHVLPQPTPSATLLVQKTAEQETAASTPTPDAAPLQEIIVQKGDSLERIARKHHVSVDALLKCNNLSSTFLKAGQTLKIPAKTTAAAPTPVPPAESADYYVMKVGDTPWTIAIKHKIKVDELLKLNGLNEEKARRLKPGDRLRIK
ncbi:MAG: LysM peptidoglycan-binding domain-containing protein [Verrucomicrobiota bacterium]|nr:LysM peptidoglycan-binding domain-containing protein [Verrucomicrobiota bacterium]